MKKHVYKCTCGANYGDCGKNNCFYILFWDTSATIQILYFQHCDSEEYADPTKEFKTVFFGDREELKELSYVVEHCIGDVSDRNLFAGVSREEYEMVLRSQPLFAPATLTAVNATTQLRTNANQTNDK